MSALAQEVRKLIDSADFSGAASLLADCPRDPDALAELAYLECLTGNEFRAAERWPHLPTGPRRNQVTQILGDHLTLVLQRNPAQPAAADGLKMLGTAYQGPNSRIGTGIAAVLIVKDEEAHLQRCLASLKGVVDQIVVVDTGSSDRTVEIATAFGARIGHFAWNSDFAAARNASLQLADHPWCLWIDADEELTGDSRDAIERARVRPQLGGYEIEIVNFTEDREGGSEFYHYPVRLFRNLPGVAFEGRVHEQISQSLQKLGLTWARLGGARILHYGYRPSEISNRDKINRTLGLLRSQIEESPNDSFAWFNLANTHAVARNWPEAERASRQAADNLKPNDPYGALTFQIQAQAALAQGDPDRAVAACNAANSRGFGGILVDFERAQAYMRAGRHEECLAVLDRCIDAEWPEGQTGDRGIVSHKARVLKSQVLTLQGNLPDAETEIDRALAVDPGFGPARFTQGAILERRGKHEEARRAYHLACGDPDSKTLATKGAARCAAATQEFRAAAQLFRTAFESDPADFESWVGWVNACQLTGDTAGLLMAYEHHAAHQHANPEILINWGRTLEAAGDPDRALQCFTEAIQRDSTCSNAYFNAGDLLSRHGRPHDAAHLYQAGLQHDPLNAEAWFTLGNALANCGHEAGAIQAYRKTLSLVPEHEKALHNIAVLLEDAA